MKALLSLVLVALVVSATEASASSNQCEQLVKRSYHELGCCASQQPNNKTLVRVTPREPSNPQLHSLEPQWEYAHGNAD